MIPRIGVTCSSQSDTVREYMAAVEQAGGAPHRLLPDVTNVARDLGDIDGLVITGGVDVDPALYGEAPHAQTDEPLAERDAFESALVRAAFEAGVPTLAICRGMQIANVAFGGTLYQHVPDVFGETIKHRLVVDGAAERGVIPDHIVDVESGSRLGAAVGASLATGSRHHQSVHRVAPPLRAVARCRDGVIEALEAPDAPGFWLAVQWHPESTLDLDGGGSRALFAALIASAVPGS